MHLVYEKLQYVHLHAYDSPYNRISRLFPLYPEVSLGSRTLFSEPLLAQQPSTVKRWRVTGMTEDKLLQPITNAPRQTSPPLPESYAAS